MQYNKPLDNLTNKEMHDLLQVLLMIVCHMQEIVMKNLVKILLIT